MSIHSSDHTRDASNSLEYDEPACIHLIIMLEEVVTREEVVTSSTKPHRRVSQVISYSLGLQMLRSDGSSSWYVPASMKDVTSLSGCI